ncbi:MAG TPA: hypothetical protein VM121_10550 [Acidimicrobiales bacterium]|nr:hypothetical protein [Acidimicrobiales bacterium]
MNKRRLSTGLLAVGYAAATASGVHIVAAIRERQAREFVFFEAGTACVVAGLLLRRRRISAALNAATLVGTAMAWRRQGRLDEAAVHKPGDT